MIKARRFKLVDNAETVTALREVISLLTGDISYDNRAKARNIVRELIGEIKEQSRVLSRSNSTFYENDTQAV